MHIEKLGQGPALVMLHGWSMHSGVWYDLAKDLALTHTVYLVDLPGHGQSDWREGDLSLPKLIGQLDEQLPPSAVLLGWSLGGLISLAFASTFPHRVSQLILFSSTPLFVSKEEWQCAVDADVFNQFASNLNDDQQQTLKRFLMLQSRGAEQSRETIRDMSERLSQQHLPHPEALAAGLKLLVELDLRSQLSQLPCPVSIVLGERDTLIPVTMLEQVKKLNPKVIYHIVKGAGHAPFISHPQQSRQFVTQLLHG